MRAEHLRIPVVGRDRDLGAIVGTARVRVLVAVDGDHRTVGTAEPDTSLTGNDERELELVAGGGLNLQPRDVRRAPSVPDRVGERCRRGLHAPKNLLAWKLGPSQSGLLPSTSRAFRRLALSESSPETCGPKNP